MRNFRRRRRCKNVQEKVLHINSKPKLTEYHMFYSFISRNEHERPVLSPRFDEPHSMAFIHLYLARKQVGELQSAGNPRCAVPAEIHWICTNRPRPGPAAGLQVSPTSDTSQPVAILMNRPHYILCDAAEVRMRRSRAIATQKRDLNLPIFSLTCVSLT